MSHNDDQPTLITLAVTLERVETKLDTLIGTDVNKGRVRILEDDVKALQAHKNHTIGWLAGAGAVGGGVVGLIVVLVRLFASHFTR